MGYYFNRRKVQRYSGLQQDHQIPTNVRPPRGLSLQTRQMSQGNVQPLLSPHWTAMHHPATRERQAQPPPRCHSSPTWSHQQQNVWQVSWQVKRHDDIVMTKYSSSRTCCDDKTSAKFQPLELCFNDQLFYCYFERVCDRRLWFFFIRMFGREEQSKMFNGSIMIGHSALERGEYGMAGLK